MSTSLRMWPVWCICMNQQVRVSVRVLKPWMFLLSGIISIANHSWFDESFILGTWLAVEKFSPMWSMPRIQESECSSVLTPGAIECVESLAIPRFSSIWNSTLESALSVTYLMCCVLYVYTYSCERQSPVLRRRQAGTPSRALYTAIACLSMLLTLHQNLRHVHFYLSLLFRSYSMAILTLTSIYLVLDRIIWQLYLTHLDMSK